MKPEQLALVRELLGLTQAQLGQVLGVHALTVSKWERGVLEPHGTYHAFYFKMHALYRLLGYAVETDKPELTGCGPDSDLDA